MDVGHVGSPSGRRGSLTPTRCSLGLPTSDSVCEVGDSTWCHFPGAGTWQPPGFHAGPWGPGFGCAGPLPNSGGPCRAGWAGASGCLVSWDVNSALERGTGQQEGLLEV